MHSGPERGMGFGCLKGRKCQAPSGAWPFAEQAIPRGGSPSIPPGGGACFRMTLPCPPLAIPPPLGGRPSLHCFARQYLLRWFVFPVCHTHFLALLSHYFESVTCVESVIFSLQRRCTGCPFFRRTMFSPGDRVWYHSRTLDAHVVATVVGPCNPLATPPPQGGRPSLGDRLLPPGGRPGTRYGGDFKGGAGYITEAFPDQMACGSDGPRCTVFRTPRAQPRGGGSKSAPHSHGAGSVISCSAERAENPRALSLRLSRSFPLQGCP